MTQNYSPLDRFTIKPAPDGFVAVTVHLPPDLVRDYCCFLESLADFFHTVDRKAKIERALVSAATCVAQIEEGQRLRLEYRARLVSSFDAYILDGLDRKEAIKRINADLRAAKHPWCGLDLVRSELVAAGRGGSVGRPRRLKG